MYIVLYFSICTHVMSENMQAGSKSCHLRIHNQTHKIVVHSV